MEGVLWNLLASSRGSQTRTRLIQKLDERPRNPNQLADALDMDYTTIRHHLDIFEKNNIVEPSDDEYGAPYLLTDQVEKHWNTVEEIIATVETEDDL